MPFVFSCAIYPMKVCLFASALTFYSESRKHLPAHWLYPTIWPPNGQGAKGLGKQLYAVMKLISTPISNHSYHSHFVSLINPILRPKHLNPRQSISIHTKHWQFYLFKLQRHYHTYSYKEWHQGVIRRPHICCSNRIYTIKTAYML